MTFMTAAEVADAMRVSQRTVYRLVHGGFLSAVRVGRSIRVSESSVREYLRNHSFDVDPADIWKSMGNVSGLKERKQGPEPASADERRTGRFLSRFRS